MNTLTAASTVCRSPDQLSTQLDGETVILSVEQGNYYKLDPVATRIWELIEKPIAISDVVETLMGEFEVDRETCEHDVVAFLVELYAESLANGDDK